MRFVYYEIAEYLQAHRLFMKGKPYVLVITRREITMENNRNSSYIPTLKLKNIHETFHLIG